MRGFGFLAFVMLTIVFWGIYGPTLHHGQEAMAGVEGQLSRMRPLVCVGIAYFLIAVLVPLIVLWRRGESGNWSLSGFVWSFAAGGIGAVGAIGIILAFENKGSPIYVMPLVFGCAPVVNTIVTMAMNRTVKEASLPFYFGVIVVAIGAAGVMYFKPTPAKITSISGSQLMTVIICIAVTALCWGSYGPVLHRGQTKMNGSRMRPFLCVGLAYFVLAVIMPYALQSVFPFGEGGWTFAGTFWSLVAGAAGAIGALGIIYAFNFGGKPIFVMPLVFGGAPVVNTFTSIIRSGVWGQVPTAFYISLTLVIFGAVTVLICAPKAVPKKVTD